MKLSTEKLATSIFSVVAHFSLVLAGGVFGLLIVVDKVDDFHAEQVALYLARPQPQVAGVSTSTILANGTFSAGTNSWTFYTDAAGSLTTPSEGQDGSAAGKISITTPGSNVQLYQAGLSLQAATAYRLSFLAKSSTSHDVSISLQEHDEDYTNYGLSNWVVDLTSSWQSFSREFTTANFTGTVNDGRLRLWLAPYDAAGDVYWFDDISLEPVVAPPAAPTGTFSVNPASLPAGGGSTTLTWTSQNATTATINQGVGSVSVSGSQSVTTTTTKTYTITLTGAGGTVNYTTTVTVASGGPEGTDTTAPTVAVSTPASGALVSGSSVTVSANASDNVGVVGVQIKVNGANLGAEDTSSPYSTTWNTTSYANGSYTLTATARDAAGNSTTSTAVSVNVDNQVVGVNPFTSIWAVDDGERIKQDKTNYALETDYTKNKVWNGNQISLFGAKNEIIGWQLILEAGASGASNVSVELPSLTNGSYTIQNDPVSQGDPYNYVGKHIQFFRQHYHTLDRRTSVSFRTWSGARALPDADFLGAVPDALIPFEAASSKGGAPFSVAASKNQGVWIDVYIPRTAPAGTYTGTVSVKVGSTVVRQIPVSFRVYNFTLPDENHLRSWWYFQPGWDSTYGDGVVGKHPVTVGSEAYKTIEGRYFQMAHRYRMDLTTETPVVDDEYNTLGLNVNQHYRRYIQGTYFTPQFGYEGPGQGVGPNSWIACLFDFAYYRSYGGKRCGFYPNTQERYRAASDQWVNWFQQNAPNVYLGKWMFEEPFTEFLNSGRLDIVGMLINQSQWIRTGTGPGRNLKLIISNWVDERLWGKVDAWNVAPQSCYQTDLSKYLPEMVYLSDKMGYCLPVVAAAKARGENVGIYMDSRPNWGMVQGIDTQAIDSRVTAWVMKRYNVDHYYQWGTTRWRKNANTRRDVYADVYSWFDTGDGFLFYPGQQKDYPGTANDKGLEGPVPSIRMANWRRGNQDYEYLWLAQQRNIDTTAIVRAAVPCSFDDYTCSGYTSQNSQPTWYQRGYQYEEARRQLAELLNAAPGGGDTTAPSVSLTAPANNATVTGISVTVSANASDNVAVAGVQFKVNGNALGAEDTTSPYSVAWNTTTYANGSYALTAVARDAAGNSTTSSGVTVSVTNSAPPVDTAAIQRVWAIDGGERIKQDDLTHPLATDYVKNKTWNGSQVSVFGAKNEVVSFQMILESSAAGASNVNVELPILTNGSYTLQNSTGSANDPYNYVGKRIEIFKQNYVNIPNRSSASPTWWSAARALPDSKFTGMQPDHLIPCQASNMGCPFSIASRKNQGVWVDVYIPKDAPAGTYTGTAVVKVGTSTVRQVPVSLRVYNFTLPDQTHLKNMFYAGGDSSEGIASKHPVSFSLSDTQYTNLEGKYAQMAQRHRMQLNFRSTPAQMASHYGRYTTGSYFTSQYGYEGPGVNTPYNMYSIGTYDQNLTNTTGVASGFTPDTQAGWWAASDAWVTWFEQFSPTTLFFKYMHDEPNTASEIAQVFPIVQQRSQWIKSNPGPGRRLKFFETLIMDPRMKESIDIFAESGQSGYYDASQPEVYYNGTRGGYWLQRANEWRQQGKMIGIYNANRPSFGAVNIVDTPAIDARVPSWVAWKYDVDFYFLWLTTRWNRSGQSRDIYADISSTYGYGDANFFYPGQQKDRAASESPGLAGPIASIRMKNWRDGAEDYEYLWLAKQRGLNINSIVDAVVPRAFDDYGGTYTSQSSQALWAQNGYQYEEARRQLAELLDVGGPEDTDTTAPVVALTTPTSGATVLGSSVTVSANATDNVGVVGVQFRLDGVNLGSEDTTAPYSIIWNTTQTTNGSHTLTAIARDARGNNGIAASRTVTVTNQPPDTQAPSVSISAPTAGAVLTSVTEISANASDNVGVTGVQFLLNGEVLAAEDTAAPYTATWQANFWSTGQYTLTARARDAAGNISTSQPVAVTVQSSGGGTPGTNVLANSGFESGVTSWSFHHSATNGGSFTSEAAPVPGYAGAKAAKVSVSQPGTNVQLYQSGVALEPNRQYRLTFRALSSSGADATVNLFQHTAPYTNYGLHETFDLGSTWQQFSRDFTTSGFSLATNSGRLQLWLAPHTGAGDVYWFDEVTLTAIGSAPTPPSGSLLAAPASLPAGGGSTTLTWSSQNAISASFDQGIGTVALVGSQAITIPATTTFTLTLTGSGGSTVLTTSVQVAAPNSDLELPVVSFVTPAEGEVTGSAVAVTATATDNVGVASVQFLLDGVALGTADTEAPYSLAWDTTELANGPHTLTAVARDAAGNVAQATREVVVRNQGIDPVPQGTLIVQHRVINNDGGTLADSSFVVRVSGVNPSPLSFPGSSAGTAVTLGIGEYQVSVQGRFNYHQTYSAACAGAIANGETKTCSVVSDDVPVGSGGGGGGGSSGGGSGGFPPIGLNHGATVPSGELTTDTVVPGRGRSTQEVQAFVAAERARVLARDVTLAKRLAGRILLQVERKGEAWYVEPRSLEKYYLADGTSAYEALRKFGLGITNADLAKIPPGNERRFVLTDTDGDGLADKLEEGLGTDVAKADSDGDGFADGVEVDSGYNPLGPGRSVVTAPLVDRLRGRILLQVERKGEAWYLNPVDGRRYYLANGEAAYQVMRYLSLGASDRDLAKISVGELEP